MMYSAQLLQQQRSSSSKDTSTTNSNSNSNLRETGIIEKLLPSYGFIQCCERQARLFFHYSQFTGNIDHLKLGDPVEFEMTYDRRTGKPIASLVVKISSEAISEELSLERVTGFITIELTEDGIKEGRVAYENRGECFFIPFNKEDLDDQASQLKSKDKVTFYIAKDNSGTLRARHICLQDPHISPQRYQGIICTLKDSFGFIERADVTKEIFFHSSECQNFKQLGLADNVEFSIQTRNNKQVAVNIDKLPDGTVVFEDIDPEQQDGQILETIERGSNHLHPIMRSYSNSNANSSNGTDAYPGNILWSENGKESEIPFSERDLKGEFTLNVGDCVKFNIAIDRRDNSKHATNIRFLEQTFVLSGEKRERGFVILLEDSFGFIKCFNKEANRVPFKYTELIDTNQKISLNDEVEFTLSNDLENSMHATRIKLLPMGTVLKMFDDSKLINNSDLQTKRETGFIVQLKSNYGLIRCLNKKGDVVSFKYDSSTLFSLNDEVEFYLNASSNSAVAIGVKKLAAGTIIKNIIAENQINDDLFNTFNMLYRGNNQFKDNQLSQLNLNSSNSLTLPNSFNETKLVLNNINSDMNNLNSLSNNLNSLNSLGNSLGNNLSNLGNSITNSISNSISNSMGSNLSNLNSFNNLNSLSNLNSLNNQFVDFTSSQDDKEPVVQLFSNLNLSTLDKIEQNHLNHNDTFINNSYLDFMQQNSNSDLLKSSSSTNDSPKQWNSNSSLRSKGFVVALKESFGFIENEDHQYEIFFHFSVFEGNFHNLALGQEVEFICKLNNGRYSADVVRKISPGTIKLNNVLSPVFNGLVIRSVRCFNPEQDDYCGLIECKDDDYLLHVTNSNEAFEFSMTSLSDIHDFIQKDDIVTFQIELTIKKRAVNVKPVREKYQAVVDSIKGSFGFLNYEVEDGKKLFFHLSEVKDPSINLQEGDSVEFVIVDNKRLKKYSACSLVRINSSNTTQRPERLKSKIQGNDDLNQNKNTLMRQPKGPDGSNGFAPRIKENSF